MAEETLDPKPGKLPKKSHPPTPTGFAPHQTQFILAILLVLSVFGNGYLWKTVQDYQKGSAATGTKEAGAPAQSPLTTSSLKAHAKALKLNENTFNSCLDSGKYKDAVASDLSQGNTLGVNGTPAFFINGRFVGGAYPFEIFKEIIDKELAGLGSNNPKDYSQQLQAAYESPNKSFNPEPKTVDISNAQTKGSKNAPVVMIEYSDFQCPFCARFYSQTLSRIQKEYIDSGKVLFVYKQFPLSQIHPLAQGAAEASLCAADQGKFWEYHDRLFTAMMGV